MSGAPFNTSAPEADSANPEQMRTALRMDAARTMVLQDIERTHREFLAPTRYLDFRLRHFYPDRINNTMLATGVAMVLLYGLLVSLRNARYG